MTTMKTTTTTAIVQARQSIATRYVGPTNSRPSRIRATCDRGSITISSEHWETFASHDARAHACAVRALLAKFAKEDGTDRSWPSFERWVCGGMPQSSKEAYVWVQLPSVPQLWRFTFIGRPVGAIGILWEHTVERYGDSEDSARMSLYDNYEHVSVTDSRQVLPRTS